MPYSFREIKKRLIKLGYFIARQSGGSHVIFKKAGHKTISLPNHGGKDISKGVEMQIIKTLKLNPDTFRNIK